MNKKLLIMGLAAAAIMAACEKTPTTGFPPDSTVDLSKLTADACPNGEFIVQDGMVLTDTLDGLQQNVKIIIAEGATVTLSNAAILAEDTGLYNTRWAGINCAGDATIVLDGENAVSSFNRCFPAIAGGPEGTTLTIRGEGSLTATAFSVGIGSSFYESCGNIRIEGGTITTVVDQGGGAGIGSDVNFSCGDITICGTAVVTATGSWDGAGIGSGEGGSRCGDIAISGNAVVTATGGLNGGGAGIGCGNGGDCGNITISGGTVWARGIGTAAGIGCGSGEGLCGDISIMCGDDFVSVTAIRGNGAKRSIGITEDVNGSNNSGAMCGRITFDGIEVFNGLEYMVFKVPEDWNYGDLIFKKSTTTFSEEEDDEGEESPYTDNTWTLTVRID